MQHSSHHSSLPPLSLPDGVDSFYVNDVNGLTMHVLAAGNPDNPCIALLHGFPDLAYGWRHVLVPLAEKGYYVIAPDQRGYGRTTGWSSNYDTQLRAFSKQNLAKDIVELLGKLSIPKVHCLVGHDFGSPVAAYLSLFREDLTERLVCMSAPFPGAPAQSKALSTPAKTDLDEALLKLEPPRKHYQSYNCGPNANTDMMECDQGLQQFLRAYYHVKSADWEHNQPAPLESWTAESISSMPHYYIMPAEMTMPEAVRPDFPVSKCDWLNELELGIYVQEFSRTQFQGGLNWYRCSNHPKFRSELALLQGKKISVPSWYIAGAADWGTHQSPGALKRMKNKATQDFRGDILIPNAGHWVQQEQPQRTIDAINIVCSSKV